MVQFRALNTSHDNRRKVRRDRLGSWCASLTPLPRTQRRERLRRRGIDHPNGVPCRDGKSSSSQIAADVLPESTGDAEPLQTTAFGSCATLCSSRATGLSARVHDRLVMPNSAAATPVSIAPSGSRTASLAPGDRPEAPMFLENPAAYVPSASAPLSGRYITDCLGHASDDKPIA